MHLSTLSPSVLVSLTLTLAASATPVNRVDAAVSRSGSPRGLFLQELLAQSPSYGGFRGNRTQSGKSNPRVGIIGGGVGGLYAAMLLDSLDVDYEILESSERVGGRVYTHRFDEERWQVSEPGEPDYYDYYDVGAMRLPVLEWQDRIIGKANNSLVTYINSKLSSDERPIKLIPYMFAANNTFNFYNDKLIQNKIKSAEAFNVPIAGGTTYDSKTFAALSPDALFQDLFLSMFKGFGTNFDSFYKQMLLHDGISVREFLAQQGLSAEQINWLETVNFGTTHFNSFSLTQLVMELWTFSANKWLCVEGGMDRIPQGMAKILKRSVELGKRVTAIKSDPSSHGLSVVVNGGEERVYDHVISTAPLGALQAIDMTELNLDYRRKLAIRKLQYDTIGKIGIKFKSRWWETLASGPIRGGQSFTDLPIRTCVYPSYGIDTHDAPGTMIASYSWAQDSARLRSYFGQDKGRDAVLDLTLRSLAALHNVSIDFLKSQYLDSHLWNWYNSPDTVGGLAMFGPSDYTTVMPPLMMPAVDGKLHLAGEAMSSGHAWIIGAVNSAYRSVAEVLAVEGLDHKLLQLTDMWGTTDEVDMKWYSGAFA
ncbi:hypothetical protein HIM_07631 [Hirsutella minnesotensis 3608]|uniref:Amine oxidase domain-containing protein n=1 Tax=Hirsutella minnesotensis 3608 TaxID=1043627 RepID=A0A0F8A469_9HYPO|nr:hypothetical protein HIM_07631 [Hirsutella minnesotensis 3608]